MTIQLLTAFNGYRPGIYSSMGGTEETRLVGLGMARYYVDGMDGESGEMVLSFNDGTLATTDGSVVAMSETTPYVNATPSAGATVFPGACELAGWYCSVAAGTITIYDALSATGTPIVPATALVAGPMPIFGAGTTGKLALTTGCHVVLSGAATVRVLVA